MKTNLCELNALNPAPFSDDVIIELGSYTQEHGYDYYSDRTRHTYSDVPLNDIIGHAQGYPSMKWGDCLNGRHLKRIDDALKKVKNNPSYYLTDIHTSDLSFVKVDKDYFILNGKHRTIVSRFLTHFNPDVFGYNPVLGNVRVHEKILDTQFMRFRSNVKEAAKRYPNLDFELRYSELASHNCLFVVDKSNLNAAVWLKRSEIPSFLDALSRPDILKKISHDQYHRFIPWRSFFKKA